MVRPPLILRKFFPSIAWKLNSYERKVYLTFDDGPVPEVTPQVLDILDKYSVKATFFCIGENVRKHPDIYQRILSDGHQTGNHTQHHLNAWKVNRDVYLDDIEKADHYIHSNLFRPPYGKITPAIINRIRNKRRIILWDVITYDFDPALNQEDVYNNVIDNVSPGSIIVLHDSIKAAPRMLGALPRIIQQLKLMDYQFALINDK
jgi:peptidoglycan-N-acetylglucosamine deacetylase